MSREEPTSEDETRGELEALRAVLLTHEAVPLGMTTRLEAAVARAAAGEDPPWSARIVVAAVAFIVLGIAAGDGLGGIEVLLIASAVLGYVWAFAVTVRVREGPE